MFSWLSPPRRPVVAAHRGSRMKAPENTLAAFRTAIDDGADAVEFDVQMTRDGVPVVIHDLRLDRTTDGRGRVRDTLYKDLRLLSAGRWFGKKFRDERVPALEEALDILAGRTGINIEIKTPPGNPGYRETLVDRCMDSIGRFRHSPSLLVSSFDHRALAMVREASQRIPIGILYHPVRHFRSPFAAASRIQASYIFFARSAMTTPLVRAVSAKGIRFGCYTINSPGVADRMLASGADVLFSDCPDTLLHHFGR